MGAWPLLGKQLICILWQELSHWPSKFSRENPSTGETHAGLIRAPPAINQRERCILGGGGNFCLKMAEGDLPQMCSVGHQFDRPTCHWPTRDWVDSIWGPTLTQGSHVTGQPGAGSTISAGLL